MAALPPRAAPVAAASRYQTTPIKQDVSSFNMPTEQQILNQQISLATTNSSPASMQALLNNPRFEQMLRDPQQARALHDNPAFKDILPKLKEEADKLPTAGTSPDGSSTNPRQTMTSALNEFTQNAPSGTPALSPPDGHTPRTEPTPPRSAQQMRPSMI